MLFYRLQRKTVTVQSTQCTRTGHRIWINFFEKFKCPKLGHLKKTRS